MKGMYSNSRLWLFENCPEAYKIKYIDKTFPDLPKSMSLFLGSMVHDSLEELYKMKMAGKILDMDEMIEHFATNWKNKFDKDIFLNNGGKPEEYLNKGMKFLLDYYLLNKPFSDNTIELEKRIMFPLDDDGNYIIQGYIDRLEKVGDMEFEVHDYKTNAYMKKQADVDADRQLAFYHLGLKQIYGNEVKVNLIWHFLAHNRKIFSKRSEEELVKLKKETLDLILKIESNKDWWACGKKWCDWCDYKRKNEIVISEDDKLGRKIFRNGDLEKFGV
jgi:hypothetical protein